MVNTVPERVQLGAATSNRKWLCDVRDPATLDFVGLFGLMEFKVKPNEATTNDDSDWEGEGWMSTTLAGLAWGAEGKLARKTTESDPTAYDPGQEIIRKASGVLRGRVFVRIYEMEPGGPREEAFQGWATPTWTPDGGNTTADDTVAVVLAGRGKPEQIEHPEGVTAVPRILSFTPASGAGDGAPLVITGSHFDDVTGVAGVKVNGANATYTKNGNVILVTMPVGVAGVVPIVVGTADPVNYTRAD